MASLKELGALSPRERRLLAQSLLLLPVSGLALRLVPLSRWQAILSRFAPLEALVPEGGLQAHDLVRMVARMVRAAALRGPYRAPCLPRAVTAWWLLRRLGLASDIRFGVRKDESGLVAHAWVECHGQTLDERPGVGSRPFARLESWATPGGIKAR